MALGTLDRTPPPFFRQGTSALTKERRRRAIEGAERHLPAADQIIPM